MRQKASLPWKGCRSCLNASPFRRLNKRSGGGGPPSVALVASPDGTGPVQPKAYQPEAVLISRDSRQSLSTRQPKSTRVPTPATFPFPSKARSLKNALCCRSQGQSSASSSCFQACLFGQTISMISLAVGERKLRSTMATNRYDKSFVSSEAETDASSASSIINQAQARSSLLSSRSMSSATALGRWRGTS